MGKEIDEQIAIAGFAKGAYTNRCGDCTREFQGAKRSVRCETCAFAAAGRALTTANEVLRHTGVRPDPGALQQASAQSRPIAPKPGDVIRVKVGGKLVNMIVVAHDDPAPKAVSVKSATYGDFRAVVARNRAALRKAAHDKRRAGPAR